MSDCTCTPCESPAYGAPGIAHCMACCMGTMIEAYNHDCPYPDHRELAHRQFPLDRLIDVALVGGTQGGTE